MKPKYQERYLKLKDKFHREAFTSQTACKYLSLPGSSGRKVLHDMVKRGLLKRIGRGLYAIATHERPITLEANITEIGTAIHKALLPEGMNYVITGLDLLSPFLDHLPVRIPHLVYAEKGSGEWAGDVLTKHNFRVLINPERKEIITGLSWAGEDELIILRETSSFYGSEDGFASAEKALIDLYFEATRRGYPLPVPELGRMFFNIVRFGSMNFPRLIRCASRRRIAPEIREILKILSSHVHIPKEMIIGLKRGNDFTATIREAVRGIIR